MAQPAVRRLVRHPVAHAAHDPGGRSQYLHPGCHALRIGDGEVGAIMAIGTQHAAAEIVEAGTGIAIDVAHHPAVPTRLAGQRQTQLERRGRRGHDEERC